VILELPQKCQSLANRELQHLMNVLFPVAHFEHAAFKARPAAFFADQFDVRQELHSTVTILRLGMPRSGAGMLNEKCPGE